MHRDDLENEGQDFCDRVRIKNGGGWNTRYVLAATYRPRRGQKKVIQSNHPNYGKSWKTIEEITDKDKALFAKWIDEGLAGGRGGSAGRAAQNLLEAQSFARRSSSRVDLMHDRTASIVAQTSGEAVIEQGVINCVKYLIDNVVHRDRHGSAGSIVKVNYVPSKRGHKLEPRSSPSSISSRRLMKFLTGRQRAPRLTQGKGKSKNFAYRSEKLRQAAATKVEADLDWLHTHHHRLATVLARQDLSSLLPDGDYSSSQMLRVNRQAMVLHKYYELLTDAIDAHREHGCHYMVTTLATRAGKVLGEDTVACSTVRIWHADYVEGSGVLKADERGHYGRELLITEEDIQHKFVKWSLRTAKDSCLSVASARDFLNTDLLRSLELSTLDEFKIKQPISISTTWRWMRAINIHRGKYQQSYYNDKHQDPVVLEDRATYIKVMDKLSLRLPLWLQMNADEFEPMRARMPQEVHVDLDDSFDAVRAALPLGGKFSVRFPGIRPFETALCRPPSIGLPAPGVDVTPTTMPSTEVTEEAGRDQAAERPRAPLPTVAMVRKMKREELKEQLAALNLSTEGLKPELCARLLEAVRANAAPVADADAGGEEDEEEWKVKKILGRRVVTNIVDDMPFDVVEYEVQWDWPDPEDPSIDEVTWEVEANLSNANEALHEYLASQPKEPGCSFRHMEGVCRCGMPLIHSGQDESIFKAYQKSAYQWVVQGVRGMRKKTDGPGEMVSGFKDEIRGFGHPLTPAELATLNAFRKARG